MARNGVPLGGGSDCPMQKQKIVYIHSLCVFVLGWL